MLLAALGGEWRSAACHDALGRPIEGRFALLGDGARAVVEVAEASGLARLERAGAPLEPLAADSAGTGELIAAAIAAGARRVLVGCGGSACTDAGLAALRHFDPAELDELTCLCDVSDPFLGALRYAPQKGASEAETESCSASASSGSPASCHTILGGCPSPARRAGSPADSGRMAPGWCPAPARCWPLSASTGASPAPTW